MPTNLRLLASFAQALIVFVQIFALLLAPARLVARDFPMRSGTAATCPATGSIWFVDATAASGGNGASWDCAFQNLQDAIDAATSGHEIWVKAGTYLPTKDPFGNAAPADPRDKVFYLKNGVGVYGGFAGTETLRSQRDWKTNVTTLSGDLGTAGNAADNSYHVTIISNINNVGGLTLDGFTVSGGNANGGSSFITVGGVSILRNQGGGMYAHNGTNTLANNIFSGNSAGDSGGGIFSVSGTNALSDNIFSGNSAGSAGGAVYLNSGAGTLTNNIFSGNSAGFGGAMFCVSGANTHTNSTFSANSATTAGGAARTVAFSAGSNDFKNCIFWGNTQGGNSAVAGADISNNAPPYSSTNTVTYSLTQQNSTFSSGTGIVNNQNPLFANAADLDGADNIFRTADDGLALLPGSPVLNVGTTSGAPATDIIGTPRPQGSGVDMGGYEFVCPATGAIWFVDAAAASGGNGASWTCAFQNLQDALDAATSGHEIWVKTGTYLPMKDPFGNANPADPRDKTFYLKDGVAIYGGFAGTETLRSQRNWATNVTKLSGDIGTAGNNTDNCYHIVLSVNDANTTVLDGFTIEKSNAEGTSLLTVEGVNIGRGQGGGLITYSANVVSNCVFSGNSAGQGGGAFVAGGTTVTDCVFSGNTALFGGGLYSVSSSVVSNCVFSGNTASNDGGGMGSTGGGATVTNCVFSGNTASGEGGGMSNFNTFFNPVVATNCLFSGNTATRGGGIRNDYSSLTAMNCTFSGNSASASGGGLYSLLTGNVTLTNCLIWNNRANGVTGSASASAVNAGVVLSITYSLIQNQNPSGAGNLNGIPNAGDANYPNFVAPLDPATAPSTAGDFHLQAYSPAANVGTSAGAPATDLFGNARPFGAAVDLGVHEMQSENTNCPATGAIWYVDASAASGGNGASWACAFQNLQDALDAASSGHEIWVKAGTYKPTKEPDGTTDAPRDFTFYLKNGVAVYGGFAGTETLRSQRDWVSNPTILSGDIGTANVNSDNCYHVVLSVNDTNTTILDGFTVQNGNANGIGSIGVESNGVNRSLGGGLYDAGTSAMFAHNTFTENAANSGGGAFNTNSNPSFADCIFSGNTAANTGGGMHSETFCTVTATRCIFTGNTAASDGGGYYIGASSTNATLTNCLFSGNSSSTYGGGAYSSGIPMTLTNCTFSGNNATSNGGGLVFNFINPTLKNCLVWNNRAGGNTGSAAANMYLISSTPAITYSLIQNHNPSGTGNLDGIANAGDSNYPAFVAPLDPATAPSTAGDFHIQPYTPVANVGTSTGAPATDLFGNARPFGAAFDLGVHEMQTANPQSCPATGAIWVVDGAAASGGNGASWACAFQNLQDALNAASSGQEIWVKAGTYFPTKDPSGNASPTDPRDKVFYLKNGVAVYGGFVGTETARSQRDWVANLTKLSGDIGTAGSISDNCYHVVLSVNDANTTVLDGFTIEKGNANGTSSLSVEGQTVPRNEGGGMRNVASAPALSNCVFSANEATKGGGIFNSDGGL